MIEVPLAFIRPSSRMPALQGHTLVHVAMLATAAVATPSFVIQNDQVGAPKFSFSDKV